MSHYKLYYFDLRGRGEAIRQLLKVAGQSFEDIKLTFEEWPKHKSDMPMGQLPMLEVDGKAKIVPTTTILRYLANKHGLAGKTDLDKARLDAVGELAQDLSSSEGTEGWYCSLINLNPKVQNKEQRDTFFKEKVMPEIEKYAPLVEKYLLYNGNNGLFLGDTETWADIVTAEVFSKYVEYGDERCLEAYPHIKDLIARVHSNPIIRKHIEERTQTAV